MMEDESQSMMLEDSFILLKGKDWIKLVSLFKERPFPIFAFKYLLYRFIKVPGSLK